MVARISEDPALVLAQGVEGLGLGLDAGTREALLDYLRLLARWNRVYNLTAVRDLSEMVVRHLLESLALVPFLHGSRVADVGSGAGLPGLPLALVQRQRQFLLLDANGKKCRFLRQAVVELGLENVEVIQSRVEAWMPQPPVDTVTARAFAPLSDMLPRVEHLGRRGTRLLAIKGARAEEEIRALRSPAQSLTVHTLRIPFSEAEHRLIDITLSAPAGVTHG